MDDTTHNQSEFDNYDDAGVPRDADVENGSYFNTNQSTISNALMDDALFASGNHENAPDVETKQENNYICESDVEAVQIDHVDAQVETDAAIEVPAEFGPVSLDDRFSSPAAILESLNDGMCTVEEVDMFIDGLKSIM